MSEREDGVHNAKKIGPLAGTVFKLAALPFQFELLHVAFRAKGQRSKVMRHWEASLLSNLFIECYL
jgi:hypothetical protein